MPAIPSVVPPVTALTENGDPPAAPVAPCPMPNLKPLLESVEKRFTPICFKRSRLTSAIFTLSVTCSGVATLRRLMTQILHAAPSLDMSTPGLSSDEAICAANAASSGDATVPVRMAVWPTFITWTSASGIAAFSTSLIEGRFWLTRTWAP